ncbi:MAG: leucine-rich repeat domain-containing protein [Bacteroidales bacterium]|nr:leucine-rich repeat domain-containing protein [Bacteroidales bacterium]
MTRLECSYNKLSSINVSALTKLTYLNCSYNQLTALNVSALSNLVQLDCANIALAMPHSEIGERFLEGQEASSVIVEWQPTIMFFASPSFGHDIRPVSHTGCPVAVVET